MRLTANKFDLQNAYQCAAVSARAYEQATVSSTETDTHAFIFFQQHYIVIGFRGTKDPRNFITDAEFFRTLLCEEINGDKCEVHAGFLRAFESIIGDLRHMLGHQPVFHYQDCRPLVITGHSLGGALAILAALELKRIGYQVSQVYTFGQPRVGNGAFSRMYNFALGAKTFRVVYEEDIVARIPHLPRMFDPYRHVGQEIFLPTDGKIIENPSVARLLASDARGAWRAFRTRGVLGLLDDALADHHVHNYVRRLHACSPPPLSPLPPVKPEPQTANQ